MGFLVWAGAHVIESKISRCNLGLVVESMISRCGVDLVVESTTSKCNLGLLVESIISRSNLDLVVESKISRCNLGLVVESRTSRCKPDLVAESKTSRCNAGPFEATEGSGPIHVCFIRKRKSTNCAIRTRKHYISKFQRNYLMFLSEPFLCRGAGAEGICQVSVVGGRVRPSGTPF